MQSQVILHVAKGIFLACGNNREYYVVGVTTFVDCIALINQSPVKIKQKFFHQPDRKSQLFSSSQSPDYCFCGFYRPPITMEITLEKDKPPTKRRKRSSLVCENCKRKKIRCDKGHPCSQCVKTGITDGCVYSSEIDGAQTNGIQKPLLPYVASAKKPLSFNNTSPANPSKNDKFRPVANFNKPVSTSERDEDPVSKSELEILKERLKQIEASIAAVPEAKPPVAAVTSDLHPPPLSHDPLATTRTPSVKFKDPSPFVPPKNEPSQPPQNYYNPQSLNFFGSATANPPLPTTNQPPLPIQLPPLNIGYNPPNSVRPDVSDERNSSNHSTPPTKSTVLSKLLLGTNPCSSPNDTINFFDDYTSIHVKEPLRRINFGPFAWSSLMKRDGGLRILWDYVIKKREEKPQYDGALVFSNSSTEITPEKADVIMKYDGDQVEKVFKKRALETDGYDDMVPYNSILKARMERNIQKAKVNQTALPLGLTFYDGKIDRELQLIDKIQMVLPKKTVIWKLLHRYFTWLYPYMPFLDQETFINDISKIIGPRSFEDIPVADLKVEKKLDLATLGLLLIVLRLTYLSLFCNKNSVNEDNLHTTDPSPAAQELKYLLSNPININAIDVAQLCLDLFQLLRKSNFTILQLAFFMRLYHTYAPEDGDGADGGDSQVLNAMLIQMAYSLGLNREPNKFADVCNDPKLNHLGRKIWHFLVVSDIYLAYAFGNPMTINRMYFDTLMPYHEPGNENLRDTTLDKYVTESYFGCCSFLDILRKILSLVLDVEGKTKMSELCSYLSEFELVINDDYGTLYDCMKPLEKNTISFAFTRNFKIKFYLSLKAFLISIFFHFYLYYEQKDINLSFFYLKKSLLISTAEIMPHYNSLLGNSEIVCDMIINPTLELIIHKSNQINLASIVRVNFVIYNMRTSPDHDTKRLNDVNYSIYFKMLCNFSSCLTRCAEVSISAISKISNRYYYAWRITKGHTYLLKTITSTKFYEENHKVAGHLRSPHYSVEQLEELIKICEKTLAKFGKAEANSQSIFCHIVEAERNGKGRMFSRNADCSPSDSPSTNSEFSKYTPSSSTTFSSTTRRNDKASQQQDTFGINTPSSKTNGYDSTSNKQDAQLDNMNGQFGFDFVDNESIDRLWLNMLSMKHDNRIYESNDAIDSDFYKSSMGTGMSPGLGMGSTGFSRSGSIVGGSPIPNPDAFATGNIGGNAGLDRFGFDLEQVSKFDIFSDLPFDQVFKLD